MPQLPLAPFWKTKEGDIKLFHGDVLGVLRRMPSRSVQCCVTSPPYWSLRDYGTASWEGGDPHCDHKRPPPKTGSTAGLIAKGFSRPFRAGEAFADHREEPWPKGICRKCGAQRIDKQLGSELSPDCLGWAKGENCAERDWSKACHVCRMVLVFRGVRRVLRDDGTVWMNYGDSYASGTVSRNDADPVGVDGFAGSRGKYGCSGIANRKGASTLAGGRVNNDRSFVAKKSGLPSGNLVGVPWRVALALQADGWILRQDIIWCKPSPMPESVKNRCTKAHEYVFLFAKKPGYFYDAEAIKELCKTDPEKIKQRIKSSKISEADRRRVAIADDSRVVTPGRIFGQETKCEAYGPMTANKRSWWVVAGQGYPGAHFATFSLKLIEPMVKAGTSEKGCCSKCGAPWKRVVERRFVGSYHSHSADGVQYGLRQSDGGPAAVYEPPKTKGWEPGCACGSPTVPCVVLDPFIGSGTTAEVALRLGRACWGIDLSEEYLANHARPRVINTLLSLGREKVERKMGAVL